MTEGTKTYAGLAVPLFGESEIKQQDITRDILTLTSGTSNTSDFLVLQDVDSSEIYRIEDDGRIWMTVTKGAGDAFACYRVQSETHAGQTYAASFLMNEETYASGRSAVLYIRMNASASGSVPQRSFMHFQDEGELGTAFFSMLGTVGDGCCAEVVTNPNSTVGLVIYLNNVKHWLLCSSVST